MLEFGVVVLEEVSSDDVVGVVVVVELASLVLDTDDCEVSVSELEDV